MSGYHFDPFREEEKVFNIVGQFRGADWMSEVRRLEVNSEGGSTFGFSHCVAAGEAKSRANPQFDLCATQEKSYGSDHVFLNRIKGADFNRETAPILFKMVDWFGFEPESVVPRLHIQHPGQVFPVHVDGLMNHKQNELTVQEMKKHPEAWARVQVMLEDWVWVMFGGWEMAILVSGVPVKLCITRGGNTPTTQPIADSHLAILCKLQELQPRRLVIGWRVPENRST